ncbi:MAG: hypothetical protein ABWZ56_02280 [Flavobacterium sp.]
MKKIESSLLPKEFIEKYNAKKGLKKGGSLCFFGHWFGKPYDNYHQILKVEYDEINDILKLTFDEKDTLSISFPKNITESDNKLTIESANKIIWKWYYYGKPKTEENLYFIEIDNKNGEITGKTNVNWYNPDFKELNIKNPAMLLV